VRLIPYLALLLVPVLPFVQRRIDRDLATLRVQHEALYLWSGEHVRRLSPGFENLMADIYWLRTVQYFGGQRAFSEDKRFDLLGPQRLGEHRSQLMKCLMIPLRRRRWNSAVDRRHAHGAEPGSLSSRRATDARCTSSGPS